MRDRERNRECTWLTTVSDYYLYTQRTIKICGNCGFFIDLNYGNFKEIKCYGSIFVYNRVEKQLKYCVYLSTYTVIFTKLVHQPGKRFVKNEKLSYVHIKHKTNDYFVFFNISTICVHLHTLVLNKNKLY